MNLVLSFLMVLLGAFSLTPNGEYIITASSCYLYEDASFDSAKVQSDNKDMILKHGQIVIFENEENEFCLVTIKNTEKSGYVYKYYISDNSSISYYPVFNATIREDTPLQNDSQIILKQNQRIYLFDGFDNKRELTPVQFIDENGTLMNGFIPTSNIKPDGVNRLLIIAIPLIAAIVTVTLSIIFIRKKKKKKS